MSAGYDVDRFVILCSFILSLDAAKVLHSMGIQVYNTMTKKKEPFSPLEEGRVRMYVCGVTVYDKCHIGHARSAIVFDVIFRYLREKGFDVNYVRNFTDVDDKIIQRARKENCPSEEIAEYYIQEFYKDMDALGVLRPTNEPRATDYIQQMINIIQSLEERGYAYEADGDVFFSVSNFKEYGRLSGRRSDELKAGARVEVDEKKRNPLDFALWKSYKPGEPAWESPWGKGRPGWHIECSAMSQQLLGETFDIHGGGKDLIFPHHENEIAQSEGATGKPFVRYWIHNGFVNIHQEKMSKSLGNVLDISDLLRLYHPEAIRLFLLSYHYRSPVDFSEKGMDESGTRMDRLYSTLGRMNGILAGSSFAQRTDISQEAFKKEEEKVLNRLEEFPYIFDDAMDDDFNTAQALAHVFELNRFLNRYMDHVSDVKEGKIRTVMELAQRTYERIGRILGLFSKKPEEYLLEITQKALTRVNLTEEEIFKTIQERQEAREARDWIRADELRKGLAEKGIILEDGIEGTTWRVKGWGP